MFDPEIVAAIAPIAAGLGVETASLLAVVEVESGGAVFAIVKGNREPLIRFEGHYFDRRLDGEKRTCARALGLANPKAGAVANPSKQEARWDLLARAAAIDAKAAFESCSWGVGQVMGAHWDWLGYASVDALVDEARDGAAGQVRLMARFIKQSGLTAALKRLDWHAFARGYNGPAYKKNAYHTKMAEAYARHRKGTPTNAEIYPTAEIQRRLVAREFMIAIDGVMGEKTRQAIRLFQIRHGLKSDGIVGPATWAALQARTTSEIAALQADISAATRTVEVAAAGPAPVVLQTYLPVPSPPAEATKGGFLAWLKSLFV